MVDDAPNSVAEAGPACKSPEPRCCQPLFPAGARTGPDGSRRPEPRFRVQRVDSGCRRLALRSSHAGLLRLSSAGFSCGVSMKRHRRAAPADELAERGVRVRSLPSFHVAAGRRNRLPMAGLLQLLRDRTGHVPATSAGCGPAWCPGEESNHRHRDFQSRALPTELPGRRPPYTGSGRALSTSVRAGPHYASSPGSSAPRIT